MWGDRSRKLYFLISYSIYTFQHAVMYTIAFEAQAVLEMGRASVFTLGHEMRKLRKIDCSCFHHCSTAVSGLKFWSPHLWSIVFFSLLHYMQFPYKNFLQLQHISSLGSISLGHIGILDRMNVLHLICGYREFFSLLCLGSMFLLQSMAMLLDFTCQFTGMPGR